MPYATMELLPPRRVLGELQPGSVRSSTGGILPYLSKVEREGLSFPLSVLESCLSLLFLLFYLFTSSV